MKSKKQAGGGAPRERRAFSAEFKVEAVRLVAERRALGVTLAQIGRQLDVWPDPLRALAREQAGGVGAPIPGEAADQELRRLRREVAVLRQESAFAKKVAADSTGECNTLGKDSGRCPKAQGLPRPPVELLRDTIEIPLRKDGEIRAVGEVLAEQSVGVLVRAALPGTLGIAEGDRDVGAHRKPVMLHQFETTIPGERGHQSRRQPPDFADQRIHDGGGILAGDAD